MKVREVIERLEMMGDDTDVSLLVHDGPVDRETTPRGLWFTLSVECVEWDSLSQTAQIIGAS